MGIGKVEKMISKELLSEIVGFEVVEILQCRDNTIVAYDGTTSSKTEDWNECFNIYELQYLIKKWAWENHYIIDSDFNVPECTATIYWVSKINKPIIFKGKTEFDAVIKASEYIQEKRNDK